MALKYQSGHGQSHFSSHQAKIIPVGEGVGLCQPGHAALGGAVAALQRHKLVFPIFITLFSSEGSWKAFVVSM